MSTVTFDDLKSPRSLGLLAVFLVVVLGVGALLGLSTAPGEWYASLDKPAFNPPNWIFAPVWTTLYVLIAIAGWRTFLTDRHSAGMRFWYGQMVLNWLWSPVFFTLHWLWPAMLIIVLMLASILAFIGNRWNRDRLSAWLFVPYAAWVSFASLLNLAVAIAN